MQEIKEYAKQQKKLLIACGSAWNPMLDKDGKPVNLLFTKKDGLRHTYASFAVSNGVNLKVIQEQLGHNDIKQTLNTYSHFTDKDKQKASDVFNAILYLVTFSSLASLLTIFNKD